MLGCFRYSWLGLGCALLLASSALAEQVRFRFAPNAAGGPLTPVAAGPNGALGERMQTLTRRVEAYPYAIRPNMLVTFRHAYTGGNVTVPLRLPDSIPRMEYRTDRVVYDYNTYTVEARFLPDGSVETVYNSGLLRPLPFGP